MIDEFLESIAGSMERMAESAERMADAVYDQSEYAKRESKAAIEMCNAARDTHRANLYDSPATVYRELADRYALELKRLRANATVADRASIDAVLNAD